MVPSYYEIDDEKCRYVDGFGRIVTKKTIYNFISARHNIEFLNRTLGSYKTSDFTAFSKLLKH